MFTKNRRRLLRHKVGRTLFEEVAYEADRRGLMSDEHFSVDGTLIEAAASIKSFRRRDDDDDTDNCGNGVSQTEDFRGEKLSNETHQSTTDPEARLMRKGKGKEAKLMFMAHALMDNRHGLGERLSSDRGQRYGGERRGAGHVDPDTGKSSPDGWSRQGLRQQGLRC